MSINLNKNQLRTALEVPPYYELPASYIVFKDGELYKAQNAHTGEIISGSDANTVLQAVWNALAPYGGIVFLKNATYDNVSLTVPTNINAQATFGLIGESYRGVVLSGANPVIKSTFTGWWPTGPEPIIFLRNLTISGTGTSSRIINLPYCFIDWDRVRIGGTGASNEDLVYVGGAASPGFPCKIGSLELHITSSNVTHLRLWLDTVTIDTLGVVMPSTNRSALRFAGEAIHIGNIMFWINSGATVARALYFEDISASIGVLHVVTGGTPQGSCNATIYATGGFAGQVVINALLDGTPKDDTHKTFYDETSRKLTRIITGNVSDYFTRVEDRITLLTSVSGLTKTDPGTSYVEFNAVCKRVVDLTGVKQARISVAAAGNEDGSGKGVCIYDVTHGQVLCEITWSGSTAIYAAGSWTDIDVGEITISIYVKGSSATEDITLYQVVLETR
jgi:hypothetical protein